MSTASPRRTRSLRASMSAEERIAQTRAAILQSLEQGLCLRWTYNRTPMRVAPQILYMAKDALHVDAIALEKNGAVPAELTLGRFKLSGLWGVAMTSEALAPIVAIDLADTRYGEAILARAET